MANLVKIGGRTFQACQLIKAAGGFWSKDALTWVMDADRFSKMVEDYPAKTRHIHIVNSEQGYPTLSSPQFMLGLSKDTTESEI